MIQSPVFLVGAERSGTTMLHLMLDSHPEITGCEGFEFLVEEVGDDGSRPPMADYLEYLSRNALFSTSDLAIDPSLDYDGLVNSFLEQRVASSGKSIVVPMVHFNFSRVLHIWPKARFIHLVRDPRDVTSSVIQMGWAGTVWHGLDKWIESEQEWTAFASKVDLSRRYELRYSDLIADHERELGKLCDFLGVRYSDEMMSYAQETDYTRPDPTRVEAWRKKLSQDKLALVEGRVGAMMVDRGFELSGGPVHQPDKAELFRLHWQDRLVRWKMRLERFGPRLFVESLLVKVIPVDAYHKSVKLRMNKVERARRKKSWR